VAERAAAANHDGRASTRTIRMPRLSEGVAIEASLIARLLRFRLLTVDASILLLPAGAPTAGGEAATTPLDRAAKRRRLSDAIKSIDQAEQELTRARHGNHGGAPHRSR
jgi:hypothetical protein